MKPVRHDSFIRGSQRHATEAVSALHFLLMFVAAGLLVLTRVEHPAVLVLEQTARQAAQPVFDFSAAMAAPVRNFGRNAGRFFTVETEFRKLERELVSVRQFLNQMSDLNARNAELARHANLVRRAKVDAITVEVIAGPRGLFGHVVKVNAGSRDGVRHGQPVFGEKGLFGRIVAVGEGTADVLVLNDINSRIPVVVGVAQQPALVVGDHSGQPRLVYLNGSETVETGDEVVTSGASGEFPRGIKVGTVLKRDGEVRVQTLARLQAGTYLTVLRYELPSAVADEAPPVDQRAGSGAVRGEASAMQAPTLPARSAPTREIVTREPR